jgi:hypothetical protein
VIVRGQFTPPLPLSWRVFGALDKSGYKEYYSGDLEKTEYTDKSEGGKGK